MKIIFCLCERQAGFSQKLRVIKTFNNAEARTALPVGVLRRLSQAFVSPARKGRTLVSTLEPTVLLESRGSQTLAAITRLLLLLLPLLRQRACFHPSGVCLALPNGGFRIHTRASSVRAHLHLHRSRSRRWTPRRISVSGRHAGALIVGLQPARCCEDAGSGPHG